MKTTDLVALPGADVADGDILHIVDMSIGADGQSKKITAAELKTYMAPPTPEVDLESDVLLAVPTPTKASGFLYMPSPVSVGEKVTIGSMVYTFVTTPVNEGEIGTGPVPLSNVVEAIRGADGRNKKHPEVVITFTDDLTFAGFEAIIAGTKGNEIILVETMVGTDNTFGSPTLINGSYGYDYIGQRILVGESMPYTEYVATPEGWQQVVSTDTIQVAQGFNSAPSNHLHYRQDLILEAADGNTWRLKVDNFGVLSTELAYDIDLNGYYKDHGIPRENLDKLQAFYDAMVTLGVRGNFFDGAVLKNGFSVIKEVNGAPIIPSLAGKANQYLFSASPTSPFPVLGDCGLHFSSVNSMRAPLAWTVAGRTLILLFQPATSFQSPFTNEAIVAQLTNSHASGTGGDTVRFQASQSLATYTSGPTGPTVTIHPMSSVHRDNVSHLNTVAVAHANSAAATVDGEIVKARGQVIQKAVSSGPHLAQVLEVNGRANNPSLSPIIPANNLNGNMALAGWFLFEMVLTEAQINGVFTAFDNLFPRWRYVCDGDSIMNFTLPRLTQCFELYGGNMELINHALGGKSHATAAAALGTPSGFNTTDLAASSYPIVADYASVDTFESGHSVNQQMTQMDSIYDYIRANNPNAVIIGRTINSTEAMEAGGWLDDLDQLNGMIRARLGTKFDVLVDQFQIAEDMKRPEYQYQHDDPLITTDGANPSIELSAKVIKRIIEGLEEKGVIIR